jgi:hypothetical protein
LGGIWMLGCVRMNSPLLGLSVKPCTPWRMVQIRIVWPPYRQ